MNNYNAIEVLITSVIRKSRITDAKIQLFESDFDRIIKLSLGGLKDE